MTTAQYLDALHRRFVSGMAKEHAYRGDLEQLLRALAPGMDITNEPANVTDCGNPDYVITKGKIPVGYIEAKDIGKDLYRTRFQSMPGIWSSYVDEHLIPRLHGFKILMASYAMAHLKLDLLLKETGYMPTREQRFKVYLTNSLEEYHPDTGTLFASWLSAEANEANHIKRDMPVMVVLGNPPYSVSSSNHTNFHYIPTPQPLPTACSPKPPVAPT